MNQPEVIKRAHACLMILVFGLSLIGCLPRASGAIAGKYVASYAPTEVWLILSNDGISLRRLKLKAAPKRSSRMEHGSTPRLIGESR